MGPVTNSPAGTITRPPPACAQAPIVLRRASAQSAWPAAAPKSVIGNWRVGNTGALMRERISGTRVHPTAIECFAAAGIAAGTAGWLFAAMASAASPVNNARRKVLAVIFIAGLSGCGLTACQCALSPLSSSLQALDLRVLDHERGTFFGGYLHRLELN